MKNILRRLTYALALVVLGATLFFALPIVSRLMNRGDEPADGALTETPLAQIQVEGAQGDNAGAVVLHNCLIALERRATIRADVVNSGVVADQIVETSGAYLQSGRGGARQFSLLLQGRIGASTSRVWQVSDGRFLFTDVAWGGGEAGQPSRRSVRRIDLALVRKRIGEPDRGVRLAPGDAAAELIQPGGWAAHGGLPMLVGALSQNFNFGTPRQMSLRNEPVYAMIGRWKPQRREQLLAPAASDDEDDPPPSAVELPARMPHHVLVAIGARDLFPHLIEYRGRGDALSQPGLADDARFRESQSPLLRMDFLNPQFDQPIAGENFVYNEPDGVDFQDVTAQRLKLVDRRGGVTTR